MTCSIYQFGANHAGEMIRCLAEPEPLWKTLLSPVLVIASLVTSFLVARWGIRNSRALARNKATLDFIEKFESTEHYRALNDTFSGLRKAGKLSTLGRPASLNERSQVLDYLNHYELVAIGILNGTLDETTYKTWMGAAFVRDWNAAADFVQSERWRLNERRDDFIYHPRNFENYGRVALRFDGNATVLTAASSPKPKVSDAGGPGDDPLPSEADVVTATAAIDRHIDAAVVPPARWGRMATMARAGRYYLARIADVLRERPPG